MRVAFVLLSPSVLAFPDPWPRRSPRQVFLPFQGADWRGARQDQEGAEAGEGRKKTEFEMQKVELTVRRATT